MMFEWDEAKRERNLVEHGVDFLDAALIFEGPTVEAVDRRRRYGETRIRAVGEVEGVAFLVVYTWRGDVRRLISAWRIGADGQRRYRAILVGRDQDTPS